jgi:hypothetical protein
MPPVGLLREIAVEFAFSRDAVRRALLQREVVMLTAAAHAIPGTLSSLGTTSVFPPRAIAATIVCKPGGVVEGIDP